MGRIDLEDYLVYRDFVMDLSNRFDALCQAAILENELMPLPLADISGPERARMAPKEYLDIHLEFWKNSKKQK